MHDHHKTNVNCGSTSDIRSVVGHPEVHVSIEYINLAFLLLETTTATTTNNQPTNQTATKTKEQMNKQHARTHARTHAHTHTHTHTLTHTLTNKQKSNKIETGVQVLM